VSTSKDALRARMTGAAARRTGTDPAPAGVTAVRSKPIRMTVEITPQLHRQLTAWARDAMLDLDLTRLTMSDAVRAMIRVTTGDADTSGKVKANVQEHTPRLTSPRVLMADGDHISRGDMPQIHISGRQRRMPELALYPVNRHPPVGQLQSMPMPEPVR
jgi:hypothetical protein